MVPLAPLQVPSLSGWIYCRVKINYSHRYTSRKFCLIIIQVSHKKHSIWLIRTDIFINLLSFESNRLNINHRPVTRMNSPRIFWTSWSKFISAWFHCDLFFYILLSFERESEGTPIYWFKSLTLNICDGCHGYFLSASTVDIEYKSGLIVHGSSGLPPPANIWSMASL